MLRRFKLNSGAALVFVVPLFFCILPFWKSPFPSLPFEEQKTYAAEKIKNVFEKNHHHLSAEKQGHFWVRLYRLTGDEKYIPSIRSYAEILAAHFKNHAQNLDSPDYIRTKEEAFLRLPEKPLLKHIYRAKYRRQWPQMAFAHRLLFLAFQLKSFGMNQGELQLEFEKTLQYLRGLSFRDYLLDDAMIRYNSTRVVNMVYQLKFLELGDYETEFTEKFKQIFFSDPDSRLDRTTYLNKIYGLTHFIIAASDFYQHPVPKEKFDWILDYYTENLEAILTRSTPDTAAEIAVCFKLAGHPNHPSVVRVQQFLLTRFNPRKGYIPSDRKEYTLDDIEHRNILAYMALLDWEKLYAGPSNFDHPVAA